MFTRLLDRGYEQEDLKVVFTEAMRKLSTEKVHVNKKDRTFSDNQLFFHLPFNPRDISRCTIRFIYEQECETQHESADSFKHFQNRNTGKVMTINKLTVAYHRAKNIRDVLVPSKLSEIEGKEVLHILQCHFLTLDK